MAVGDRDEDRDDPEADQAQQRPEQRAAPRAEVSARGVAVRTGGGDERRGGSRRLPESGRVGLGVVGDDGGDRESEHEAQPEQESDREFLAALGGGDIEPEDERDRADEQHQPDRAGQIAAEVGAERGEADRDSDEPHDFAEQLPSVALDRFDAEGRVVVRGVDRAHDVTPDRGLC